jgi:hypothetical protein
MCKYPKEKGREAEYSTILASAPKAMGKSDERDCPESEKVNGCKILPNAPEAMPKVGGARGPKMNASNLHMIHPSMPEAMLKTDGASSTFGEP